MPKRRGRKSASQTPSPKKDRIYGSKKNPEGSAKSEESAKNIKLSSKIIASLFAKLKEFKAENPKVKTITISDLKAVYRRGLGAYSSTHRPTISGGKPNTRNAWAMARVNKFLEKASGKKVKEAYVQDDDLLKYENGGEVKSFFTWFHNWYRGVLNELNVMISVPNQLTPIPYKEKNVVILDLFEKIDQSIDAKPYLRELLNKADEYGITIYLFPEPRYKYIQDVEHRNKITRDYLIKYYRSFGFELTPNQEFMKRLPNNYAKGGLLAPNGKPSNLTPQQWKLVRTPEFKGWFGDFENDPENASKVVDENGEPLVVYRGMPSKRKFGNVFRSNVKLFDNRQTNKFGFYFSRTREEAELYGYHFEDDYIIKSYFLNIRNLFVVVKKDSVASKVKRNLKSQYPNSFTLYNKPIPDIDKELGKSYLTFKEVFDLTKPSKKDFEILNDYYESNDWNIPKKAKDEYDEEQIRRNANQVFTHFIDLKKNDNKQGFWRNYLHNVKGYDGLLFYEDTYALSFVGKKGETPIVSFLDYPNTYCVFEPQNIKLADGSNTTFDGNNPDIRYDGGGNVLDYDNDYYDEDDNDEILNTLAYKFNTDLKKLYPENDRYILSHENKIEFRDVEQTESKMKPKGLWYAIGTEWANFVVTQMPDRAMIYKNLFRIDVTNKVLRLETIEQAIEFTKLYRSQNQPIDSTWLIDWDRVANDWSGIEVLNPRTWSMRNRLNRSLDWLYSWDIASGCVWKSDGIENIEALITDFKMENGGNIYEGQNKNNNEMKTLVIFEDRPNEILDGKLGFKDIYSMYGVMPIDVKHIETLNKEITNDFIQWSDKYVYEHFGSRFEVGYPMYVHEVDADGNEVITIASGELMDGTWVEFDANDLQWYDKRYHSGGVTNRYEISDYWESDKFDGGGFNKAKNIITEKIGWNEEIADYLIEQSPKLAIWLADTIMKKEMKDSYGGSFEDVDNIFGGYYVKIDNDKVARKAVAKHYNKSNFVNRYRYNIRLILDWLQHPITPKQDLKAISFNEAIDKANQWHEELKVIGGDIDFKEPEENEIIITYPKDSDGAEYYWVKIPSNYCDLESKRMGHCGRTGYGNTLISLRSVRPYGKGHTINDSHVTIAYNEKEGLFMQSKGKKNQKPSEKYYPFIFDLVFKLATTDRYDSVYVEELHQQENEFNRMYDDLQKKLERYGFSETMSSSETMDYRNGIPKFSEEWQDLKITKTKLESKLNEVKNNKDWDEISNAIKDVENDMQRISEDVIDLMQGRTNTYVAIKEVKRKLEEVDEMPKYGFNGFGYEYLSSEDYGYDDMTKEEFKSLYEVRPDLFKGLSGEVILYEKGIIDTKPNTKFMIKKDAKYVSELLQLDGRMRDDLVETILSGDTYDLISYDYMNDRDALQYLFPNLDKGNVEMVEEEISKITSLPFETIKENGAEYYLSGDYKDDSDEDYDFDSIFRALNQAEEGAIADSYYSYLYKELKKSLSELGEIEYLNDEGVVIEVDLTNLMSLNELSSYSKEYETDDLETIFFEYIGNEYDVLPYFGVDDRYSPYSDLKEFNEIFASSDFYAKGGVTTDEQKETYDKWKSLVNMSKSELMDFYNSKEGKEAGLSPSEANAQGIDSGRESARWIMKMKDKPYKEWTSTMWKWAKKQISFISRMRGNKGGLYDDNGVKTRKHTSLLIWGHNPEKYEHGGEIQYKVFANNRYVNVKPSDKVHSFGKLRSFVVNNNLSDSIVKSQGGYYAIRPDGTMVKVFQSLNDVTYEQLYEILSKNQSNSFSDGGVMESEKIIINNKNINEMDLHEYNNLPHIDTLNGGDKIVLKEDVFSGDYEKPTHQGFRFIVCEVMGEGGITNSASLRVLNSIGSSALEFGRVITRPISNLVNKGRKLINMEHGGLNELYIGDEVKYKGTNYVVDGLSDCNKYVKCKCVANGNKSEFDVQDLMDNSSLIKRN